MKQELNVSMKNVNRNIEPQVKIASIDYGSDYFNSLHPIYLRATAMTLLLMQDPNARHMLLPVDKSVYPEYYEVVKRPMDFTTGK